MSANDEMELITDLTGLPPKLQALLALWQGGRQGASLPARASLTPRDLLPVLPGVHVYEVIENNRFTARLLGTAIVAAIGADQTGRSFGKEDRDILATRAYAALSEVQRTGQPLHTRARRIPSLKQSMHAAESLWLPFGAGTTVEQILAATILTNLA